MSTYRAPMQEIQFVMNELAGLEQVGKLPGYEDATPDTVTAILEEASKFATEVLDPLNAVGDREGATWLEGGKVGTHIISKWPEDALKVVSRQQIKPKEWHHVAVTYGGGSNSKARASISRATIASSRTISHWSGSTCGSPG